MREGLTCVLSVKVPEPKFSSQTKDKLVSSEVHAGGAGAGLGEAAEFLLEHPADAKIIAARSSTPRARARPRARRAR